MFDYTRTETTLKILRVLFSSDLPQPSLEHWERENTPSCGFIGFKMADRDGQMLAKIYDLIYQFTIIDLTTKICGNNYDKMWHFNKIYLLKIENSISRFRTCLHLQIKIRVYCLFTRDFRSGFKSISSSGLITQGLRELWDDSRANFLYCFDPRFLIPSYSKSELSGKALWDIKHVYWLSRPLVEHSLYVAEISAVSDTSKLRVPK